MEGWQVMSLLLHNKMIKVFAYKRSGTHFLMSSLYYNYYNDQDLSEVMYRKFIWYDDEGEHRSRKIKMKWLKLFGGHVNANVLSKEIIYNRNIYLYRDGRDVLVSMWKMLQTDKEFLEWLNKSLIELWWENVNAWLKTNIFKVSYNELINDFENTMKKIEKSFCLKRLNIKLIKPGKVGWNPGKAKIGLYKLYWDKKSLKLFDDITDSFRIQQKEEGKNVAYNI